jgi:hypothetical protein
MDIPMIEIDSGLVPELAVTNVFPFGLIIIP